MNYLYEQEDLLNSPIEAFYYDTATQPFPIESHWHYYAETIYIFEGNAWITCNGKSHVLNAGELIFLPPQAMHSIFTTTDRPLRYGVLKFDPNRINLSGEYLPKVNALFRSITKEPDFPLTFSNEDFPEFSLHDFFIHCMKEMEEKRYGYDCYLFSGISLLILQMLRNWKEHGLLEQLEYNKKSDDSSIHDVLMYIDEHSHEKLVVEDLAKMCHMSYSYFAKTFHRLYGQSCKEYIESVRLGKAENLLLFTSHDLNYISNETGFSDCSHFIRVFKRKYHMTPKQYRTTNSH